MSDNGSVLLVFSPSQGNTVIDRDNEFIYPQTLDLAFFEPYGYGLSKDGAKILSQDGFRGLSIFEWKTGDIKTIGIDDGSTT